MLRPKARNYKINNRDVNKSIELIFVQRQKSIWILPRLFTIWLGITLLRFYCCRQSASSVFSILQTGHPSTHGPFHNGIKTPSLGFFCTGVYSQQLKLELLGLNGNWRWVLRWRLSTWGRVINPILLTLNCAIFSQLNTLTLPTGLNCLSKPAPSELIIKSGVRVQVFEYVASLKLMNFYCFQICSSTFDVNDDWFSIFFSVQVHCSDFKAPGGLL